MGGTAEFDPNSSINKMLLGIMGAKKGLRYKGFLGPSINERRDLPSVGHRSAMSRGIIIDENGKMRCPPGTPNANQFTDINMSNCAVPSLETLASGAVNEAETIADRALDGFRRGLRTKNKREPDLIPNAGVAASDADGFLQQKRVFEGAEVISPITGERKQLNNVADSVQHIAEGGKLSDIPDEHLIDSIEQNTGDNLRFSIIGDGGGVNGMQRLRDGHTGAEIGIKYAHSGGELDENEPIDELVGELFLEHFGFEPIPMRLTMRTRRGKPSGLALVTELAQNRRSGEIDEAHASLFKDVKPPAIEDVLPMIVADGIMTNNDRHDGNFLLSHANGGTPDVIPIDNSLAFGEGLPTAREFRKAGTEEGVPYFINTQRADVSFCIKKAFAQHLDPYVIDPVTKKYADNPNRVEYEDLYNQLVNHVSALQDQTRSIDADLLRRQVDAVYEHASSLGVRVSRRKQKLHDAAFKRLQWFNDADPASVADSLLPPTKEDNWLLQ